jgi:hypothetical protein
MLDRSLALRLRLGPWAASGEDSSRRSCLHNGARAEETRALFLSNTAGERLELLWIVSIYLVGMNESGNQKGNLSYLAGTKKRSDSLMQ